MEIAPTARKHCQIHFSRGDRNGAPLFYRYEVGDFVYFLIRANKKIDLVFSAMMDAALHWAEKAGYSAMIVGRVEEGERKVIFEPEGITLPPPGD